MKALISLMLVTSIVGAQEVRAPQRGEERREPNRVERPEPVRVQPEPPRSEQPPRRAEPRPEPIRVSPPGVGRPDRVVILDPWTRNRGDCWNRMDCGISPWVLMQMDFNRRQQINRNQRPIRQRWEHLTPKQQEKLVELRKEYREKVRKILNNP